MIKNKYNLIEEVFLFIYQIGHGNYGTVFKGKLKDLSNNPSNSNINYAVKIVYFKIY